MINVAQIVGGIGAAFIMIGLWRFGAAVIEPKSRASDVRAGLWTLGIGFSILGLITIFHI